MRRRIDFHDFMHVYTECISAMLEERNLHVKAIDEKWIVHWDASTRRYDTAIEVAVSYENSKYGTKCEGRYEGVFDGNDTLEYILENIADALKEV